MKRMNRLLLIAGAVLIAASCGKVNYKKTASGLVYKLFPSATKDSLLKEGMIAKVEITAKLDDSLLYSSYGRVPVFIKLQPLRTSYDLLEIIHMMKKGDSAVCVQLVDSLIKKGQQLPMNAQKGSRITTTMRVVEVFNNDSIAKADYDMLAEKDRPRQLKEQEEQEARMRQLMKEQEEKGLQELEKSGEMARLDKVVQDYINNKKVKAIKAGRGTFVEVKNNGTGPLATDGKYLLVQYTGRLLRNDSIFESNSYPLQLGKGQVIPGWEEGLKLFNKGASGTIYIPGYRAYGKQPPPGSPFRENDALIFDVTINEISDSMPTMPQELPRSSGKK